MGSLWRAACHYGSNGFLVYEYPGEAQCESEIPNLALEAVSTKVAALKRPAAAKAVQKRPAAQRLQRQMVNVQKGLCILCDLPKLLIQKEPTSLLVEQQA